MPKASSLERHRAICRLIYKLRAQAGSERETPTRRHLPWLEGFGLDPS